MNKVKILCFSLFLFLATTLSSNASLIVNEPWTTSTFNTPQAEPFAWDSSVAAWKNYFFYTADDGKIYAQSVLNSANTVVCDTSALTSWGVAGLMVSDDDRLYFHDNGNSANIYRVNLKSSWPTDYEQLDTECSGSIYSITQNPGDGKIWFASCSLASDMFYLYQISDDFNNTNEFLNFSTFHQGGNGPIIFKDSQSLYYGESVWGGDGYFHLIYTNCTTCLPESDIFTFSNGLASAAYDNGGTVYVTTGDGKKIISLENETKTQIAETTESAQGISFSSSRGEFVISEMDAAGAVSFDSLKNNSNTNNGSGSGGGCIYNPQGKNGYELLIILSILAVIRLVIVLKNQNKA